MSALQTGSAALSAWELNLTDVTDIGGLNFNFLSTIRKNPVTRDTPPKGPEINQRLAGNIKKQREYLWYLRPQHPS